MTIGKNTLFDFDTPVERYATASLKWDKYRDRDIIPLWVADMDFRSPPAVIRALQHRVAYGCIRLYPRAKGIKRRGCSHA